MKARLRHIVYSWIILTCFVAGQVTAFSHRHPAESNTHSYLEKYASSGQTVKEKCYVCDAMHHTSMAMFTDALQSVPAIIIGTEYNCLHDYTGIILVLSAGRSPPVC